MADEKELLQLNALLEARSAASGMDLSNISEETKKRVAAMLRSRRERMMEEEKSYMEDLRQGEANLKFATELGATMTEDEKTARLVVAKQAEKAFERLVKVFDEQFAHLSAGMLTLRQQKEIEASRAKKLKSLEHQLNRERFYLYWEHHNKQRRELLRTLEGQPGGAATAIAGLSPNQKRSNLADLSSPAAQMHRMTAVLRRAYTNSAPAFATDPEELWKRGQALPPTAAAAATAPIGVGDIDLPAYHDLGAKLREKYQKHIRTNGVGFSIGAPSVPAATSLLGAKPKSSASFPHQQDSPFATAVHKDLSQFV
jgi:hypothetical protein